MQKEIFGRPLVKRSPYPIGPLSVCPVLSVCLSVTLVYCGQTVGWIRRKLGTQVGLGPGHIMLASPRKGAQHPHFRSLRAQTLPAPATV